MTIVVYALGFAFRFVLHNSPDSLEIFITEDLMIVLSVSHHQIMPMNMC
jgi:hypothetical protein